MKFSGSYKKELTVLRNWKFDSTSSSMSSAKFLDSCQGYYI